MRLSIESQFCACVPEPLLPRLHRNIHLVKQCCLPVPEGMKSARRDSEVRAKRMQLSLHEQIRVPRCSVLGAKNKLARIVLPKRTKSSTARR